MVVNIFPYLGTSLFSLEGSTDGKSMLDKILQFIASGSNNKTTLNSGEGKNHWIEKTPARVHVDTASCHCLLFQGLMLVCMRVLDSAHKCDC